MRIFYPTDFSAASLNAFVYALQLARANNAEIVTFHAYSIPDIRGAHLPNTLREVYESISLEKFEDYKDSIPLLKEICEKQNCTNIPIWHVLHHGEPVEAILNAIPANKADMVVMGSTGAGMMKELFVGSVAAEVMENANVPVLAVPLGAVYRGPITRVAFAMETFEEGAKALPRVREIASSLGARVICVYADTAHTSQYTALSEEFHAQFPDVELQVLDSIDVEESIKGFIRAQSIDILAMLIHKRNKLQELFTYSMTKRFARHLKVPILAIQAHTLPA